MGKVPIIICTAQLHPKSALCFISLIQYLNFAGLLQYFAVISLTFQLLLIINAPTRSQSPSKLKFKRPLAALNALAGAAGKQATDHDGGESGEAAPHI